jgi:hypothetical protein
MAWNRFGKEMKVSSRDAANLALKKSRELGGRLNPGATRAVATSAYSRHSGSLRQSQAKVSREMRSNAPNKGARVNAARTAHRNNVSRFKRDLTRRIRAASRKKR